MNKIWRVVSSIALLCLVLGVAGIGIGFFTGSSPVLIQEHGNLTEYFQRLQINWTVFQQDIASLLAVFGL